MSSSKPNLFTRDDTFLGVCEGLGEDLGVPANLLRLAFAGFLFWNPALALAAYAGLGAVLAVTRWLMPDMRPVAAEDWASTPVVALPLAAEQEEEHEPLPLAA